MSRTRMVTAGAVVAAAVAGAGLLALDRDAAPPSSPPSSPSSSPSAAPRPQRMAVQVHPAIAQPGPEPAPADQAEQVVSVQVEPSRKGQPVALQRRVGDEWVEVGAAATDRSGRAELTAPVAGGGGHKAFRVVAEPQGDLEGAASARLSTRKWRQPDFSDEFDGDRLDETRWTHRLQGYLPDSHRKCSRPDPSAVSVADGTARLQVMADPARASERCTRDEDGEEFSYRLNANVGTEGKYSFQYGYAAARVRFQPLRGQHGGFWLQGGKEIDVVEYFGDSHPSPLTSWVYDYATSEKVGAGGGTDGSVQRPRRFGEDWSGRFHVFSVEWTPEEYVFRIDGTEVWRTDELVSQQPEFLVMSLLSSDYYLQHMDESELPQTMYVDWVRVWER